ncbi:MAG: hypothetical protein AABX74_05810 [Nanoarchaeota archaeon]
MEAIKEQKIKVREEESQSYPELASKFNELDLFMKIAVHYLYQIDRPIMFVLLWKKLKASDYKKETFRKKLHRYEDLGIYELVNSNGLMVIPKSEMRDNILFLTKKHFSELGLGDMNDRYR